ncbi:hypothetical protein [Microvirga sp. BSC39]|uniref:DUF6894 family protein n=1 Tax=Microvirga sp. BSC39 TaxID=1549810 RepID=UPI0004E88EDF|nr:hypothetical protein [Microvirga sp. BSC39]KFG70928.1 hypothetical protein JH26_01235 [Microvirga sp. BSC39]
MRRYFFHLRSDAGRSLDQIGFLLPDHATAGREALRAVRQIMRGPPPDEYRSWKGWQIEVEDDQGTSVLVLPFSSVLAISPQDQAAGGKAKSGPDV